MHCVQVLAVDLVAKTLRASIRSCSEIRKASDNSAIVRGNVGEMGQFFSFIFAVCCQTQTEIFKLELKNCQNGHAWNGQTVPFFLFDELVHLP